MATPAAQMMNGARRLTFEDSQTTVQMEIVARMFGGTVNLENGMLMRSEPFPGRWFVTHNCACQFWKPSSAMIVG